MPLFNARILKILLILLIMLIVIGCVMSAPSSTPTPKIKGTPTRHPTSTPTPQPIGSAANPLTIAFIDDPSSPNFKANTQALIDKISQLTKYKVQAVIINNYPDLLDKMKSGVVNVSWLPPLTYIYAKNKGIARVLFLINHFGVYEYGTQFLVNSNGGFKPYFDPLTEKNSGQAGDALKQFQGKRPCWVDPTSASGYILPLGILAENQIGVLQGVFTQNHSSVVRSLYLNGICDFGATFSYSGDPRTSSAVQQDLPDVLTRVPVIWQSDPVIPNTNVSINPKLSKDITSNISDAFLEIIKTPEGKKLISDALNYDVQGFLPVNDDAYTPLEKASNILGIDIQTMIGK
jgi:phosphonate transport system substrate-binding protein